MGRWKRRPSVTTNTARCDAGRKQPRGPRDEGGRAPRKRYAQRDAGSAMRARLHTVRRQQVPPELTPSHLPPTALCSMRCVGRPSCPSTRPPACAERRVTPRSRSCRWRHGVRRRCTARVKLSKPKSGPGAARRCRHASACRALHSSAPLRGRDRGRLREIDPQRPIPAAGAPPAHRLGRLRRGNALWAATGSVVSV